MNEFADLTDDEFAEHYLNSDLNEEAATTVHQQAKSPLSGRSEELLQEGASSQAGWENQLWQHYDIKWHKNTGDQPASQDWQVKGAVSPVNNQAKCFACYAFAACGAIEGAVWTHHKKFERLSAQQVLCCFLPEFEKHMLADCGLLCSQFRFYEPWL